MLNVLMDNVSAKMDSSHKAMYALTLTSAEQKLTVAENDPFVLIHLEHLNVNALSKYFFFYFLFAYIKRIFLRFQRGLFSKLISNPIFINFCLFLI